MKVLTTLTLLFTYYACYCINSSSDSDTDTCNSNSDNEEGTFKLPKNLEKYSDKDFEKKFRRLKLGDGRRRTPIPPSFKQNPENQAGQNPESNPQEPQNASGYTPPTSGGATGYTPQQPQGYDESRQRLRGPYTSTPQQPSKIPPPPPQFSLGPAYYPPVTPPPGYQEPQGASGYTPQQPRPYQSTGYRQGPNYPQSPSRPPSVVIPPPGIPPITICSGCGPAGTHSPHHHSGPGMYEEVQQGIARREERKHPEPQRINDIILNTKDKDAGRYVDFESSYGPNGHICHIFRPGAGALFLEVQHKTETLWRGSGNERAIEVIMYNIGFPNKSAIITLNNGDRLFFKKRKKGWTREQSLNL